MLEVWDAYNESFEKIENIQLIRKQPIPEGMYHLVSDIIVQHQDGTYLLMQRDWQKRFGGLWELSAGGAALQNETALQCAKRELKEETGIVSQDFSEIGRSMDKEHQTLYVIFLCHTDVLKDSISLQEGETIDYRWENLKTIIHNKDVISLRSIEILKKAIVQNKVQ